MGWVHAASSLAVSVIALAPCAAQRPALTVQDHLTVEILSVDVGKQTPRIPVQNGAAPRAPQAFTVVDRKVAWRIGTRKVGEASALKTELERVHADKSSWKDDPVSGERRPLPLVIKPDSRARWVDVVDAIDVTLEAGFDDIHCADVGAVAIIFVAKAVDDPVRAAGAHVVPKAEYSRTKIPLATGARSSTSVRTAASTTRARRCSIQSRTMVTSRR